MNSVKPLVGLLVLLLSAALAPATASAAIFLEYGKIKGDVDQPEYIDQIQIDSFSWGLVRPVSFTAGGGGPQTSNPQALEVILTKQLDSSSTALAMELLTGKGDNKVVIRFVRTAAETLEEFLELELCQAFITSLSTSGGSDGKPMETVTLNLSAFGMKHTAYDEGGKVVNTQSVNWDFQIGDAGSCGS